MDAKVTAVEINVEMDRDGRPAIDEINGLSYCRLSWLRGGGPPFSRGIYLWTSHDFKVLYVGKATSNQTSHLYRRITAYKRATSGKTQWTSLRLNADILGYVQRGGRIRLICLATPDANPDDVSGVEGAFIRRARPLWNRQGNPNPRTVDGAMPLAELLEVSSVEPLPSAVSLST